MSKNIYNQYIHKLNYVTIKIEEYSKNKKVRQVIVLYLVNILGIPLGIVTSILITKYLGAQAYGDYSFLNNIFNFAIIIFSFGFFQAGNRALVINTDKQKAREIYGAVLVILIALFVLMTLFLVIYGLIDPNLEEKGLSNIFFILLPFSWIFLLTNYFETLFQADNRINELAKTRLYPKIGFFISALIIYFYSSKIEVNKVGLIWGLYILTFIIIYFYTLNQIQLSFKRLKSNLKVIWGFNKTFGFDVYIGSLFSVGLANLSAVLISYFGIDNSGVGFYTLALTFSSPLMLIPNVIATTHYKDFALQKKIPKKLTQFTIGLTTISLVGLALIVGPFINLFYDSSFHSVIKLNLIVSIGIAFHGLADYYNRFLGAHGKGKALRNGSIIVGISILIMNLTFIPIWKETGAAIAKLFTGIIYFVNMFYYYLRFKKSIIQV